MEKLSLNLLWLYRKNKNSGDIYLFLLVVVVPILLIFASLISGAYNFYQLKSQMQNILDTSVTSAVSDAMNDNYRQEYKGTINPDYVKEKIYSYLEQNFNLDTTLTPKKGSVLENPLIVDNISVQSSSPKVEVEISSVRTVTIWQGLGISLSVPAKTVVQNIRTDGK